MNVTVDLDSLEHVVDLFIHEVDYYDVSRNPGARESLLAILKPMAEAGSRMKWGSYPTHTIEKEIADLTEALAEDAAEIAREEAEQK